MIFPPEPSKECVKVSHVTFECRVINHHPNNSVTQIAFVCKIPYRRARALGLSQRYLAYKYCTSNFHVTKALMYIQTLYTLTCNETNLNVTYNIPYHRALDVFFRPSEQMFMLYARSKIHLLARATYKSESISYILTKTFLCQ